MQASDVQRYLETYEAPMEDLEELLTDGLEEAN